MPSLQSLWVGPRGLTGVSGARHRRRPSLIQPPRSWPANEFAGPRKNLLRDKQAILRGVRLEGAEKSRLSARPHKYRDVFPLRGNGHSRRLAGSFRVMSLRDPRPPLRGPRAASLALDNLSKVASGLAPCLPQKSLGHTPAYFRNRAPSARPRKYRDVFPLRGNGHSRRLAGSFRVMSLRDP